MLKWVRKSLDRIDPSSLVYGSDCNPKCLGRYFVDRFWHTKPFDTISFEELVAYCKEHNIRWIIPTRDGELLKFAKWKERLQEEGVSVMVSDARAVEICNDKLAFAKYFEGQAVPTFENQEEVGDKRILTKDRYGSGGSQVIHPIYQPYIEGVEFSIDLYLTQDKKVKGGVVRSRDVVVSGESQVTSLVHDPDLLNRCAKAAESLGLTGHVLFQAIGKKRALLECNPRFGGASTLSLKAGLHSFYWFFLETEGHPLAQYPFEPTKPPLQLVRYPEDWFIDV